MSARRGRGLVLGKFAPFHLGHRLVVETALARSDNVLVLVYAVPDFRDMPSGRRAGWIRTLFPAVDVRVPEGAPPDDAPAAIQRAFLARWLAERGLAIDAVFTSEDYGEAVATDLSARHVAVDPGRTLVQVSGTMVRRNPAAAAALLDPPVFADLLRMHDPEALIGG